MSSGIGTGISGTAQHGTARHSTSQDCPFLQEYVPQPRAGSSVPVLKGHFCKVLTIILHICYSLLPELHWAKTFGLGSYFLLPILKEEINGIKIQMTSFLCMEKPSCSLTYQLTCFKLFTRNQYLHLIPAKPNDANVTCISK